MELCYYEISRNPFSFYYCDVFPLAAIDAVVKSNQIRRGKRKADGRRFGCREAQTQYWKLAEPLNWGRTVVVVFISGLAIH